MNIALAALAGEKSRLFCPISCSKVFEDLQTLKTPADDSGYAPYLSLVRMHTQVLMDKAGDIASSGITSLWLPPPSDSVSSQVPFHSSHTLRQVPVRRCLFAGA